MKRKILSTANLFFVFMFITGLNSCDEKCEDCFTTPPPLNTYATQLEARDHDIDSATAVEWIGRYVANKDSICHNMVGTYDSVLNYAEDFNKQSILNFLCVDTCIGIRIYQGMDTNFNVHNIIVGVSQSGNNVFVAGKAAENGSCPYPPHCNN